MSRHVSMTHTCHEVMSHTIRYRVMLIQQKIHRYECIVLANLSSVIVWSLSHNASPKTWWMLVLRWGLGGLSQIRNACGWLNLQYESIKSGLFAVRGFWDMACVKSVTQRINENEMNIGFLTCGLGECYNLLCPCRCSPMPVYECCNVLWGYISMIRLRLYFLNMSRHVSNMSRHVSMTHACHMVMSHTIRSWVMLIQQKSKPTHRQQLVEFCCWDTACVKSVTQCVDKNVMNVGFWDEV